MYSFGVVLLELLTAERAFQPTRPSPNLVGHCFSEAGAALKAANLTMDDINATEIVGGAVRLPKLSKTSVGRGRSETRSRRSRGSNGREREAPERSTTER